MSSGSSGSSNCSKRLPQPASLQRRVISHRVCVAGLVYHCVMLGGRSDMCATPVAIAVVEGVAHAVE